MPAWQHVLDWRAAHDADRIALSDDRGGELGYAELADAVEREAARLAAAGVAPGDVVPLLAHNRVEWAVTLFGLLRAGALPAPVNWRLAPPEVAVLLDMMRARHVVADDAGAQLLGKVDGFGGTVLPLLPDPPAGSTPPVRTHERMLTSAPCALLHTSGTTGRPKLVPVTHEMLISAATFMSLEVPEAMPGARHLSALPLFHVAGLVNLGYALFTGGHLHLLDGFVPPRFVDELTNRRIQLTQLVPTLVDAVTSEVASRATAPDLSALVEVVYGASAIRPEVLERAVTTLGCRFRQAYASTETGPLPISSLTPADHDVSLGRLASAGRPSLGWEIRLGEHGEVQVRGAAPFPGYWNDPVATRQVLTSDGFYRTGDIGTIDADGYLTLVDRLKDMVVSGGENVYPAEVEAVLAAHPAVREVAVIGVPHPRWGETVHAVVVPADGEADGEGEFAAEQFLAWARERLAHFKAPTGITVAAHLPRNATGKVLKGPLREPFWAGHARRVS
ncbi:class I adenylate-forming enzyme family protein [Streptomyces sp. NPDC002795]|uniref:class I adenylate-forming enzyme family protein n=1 Tax=Streptomyces sp. NPDC002795 TaxID=3364665 RepID=UPI0036CBDE16